MKIAATIHFAMYAIMAAGLWYTTLDLDRQATALLAAGVILCLGVVNTRQLLLARNKS